MPDTATMVIVLVMLMLTIFTICVTLLGFRFLELADAQVSRIFPSRTDHRFEQRIRAVEAELETKIARTDARLAQVQTNISKAAANAAFGHDDED